MYSHSVRLWGNLYQLTNVYLNLSVAVSQGGCFYSYTSWYKRIRDGAHVFIFGTLSMSRCGCICMVEHTSIVLYDSCIYGVTVYKTTPGRDTVPKLKLIGMVRVQAPPSAPRLNSETPSHMLSSPGNAAYPKALFKITMKMHPAAPRTGWKRASGKHRNDQKKKKRKINKEQILAGFREGYFSSLAPNEDSMIYNVRAARFFNRARKGYLNFMSS